MRLWSCDLENQCSFNKYNLESAEGLSRCTSDVAEFLLQLYGLKDYLPLQAPRMVLWEHLLCFVANISNLPVSTLSPILVDMKGNMELYDMMSFADFEAKYGIPYLMGAIYTCLVGDMNEWYLTLPGVMDHIDTKRREFFQKYRRYPGIPRLTRWGRAYIKKEQLVRQLRSSRPPSRGLTWNLIESPHLVDDVGAFITGDMHLAMQSKGGFSSYILKVACDGRNIACIILTKALFNDMSVTPQPRGFYSELNSNFVQGRNKWLPLRPGRC